ncbi:MAG: hypothetical protein LBG71_00310, partial [Clostridiales Family XIII bacterium]|nr:hypothetical protein [Clostridiales Family XIII bacterium]
LAALGEGHGHESGPRRAGEKKKNQLAEIAMGTGRLKKDSRPHPQQLDTVGRFRVVDFVRGLWYTGQNRRYRSAIKMLCFPYLRSQLRPGSRKLLRIAWGSSTSVTLQV